MSEGVEWAAHCCLLLDWLGNEGPVPTSRLAAAFETPPAYLNKQLQALVRAGLLSSTAGVKGGFRLARPLEEITLMDVVTAIEGPDDAFRCTEIRRKGPGSTTPESIFDTPCAVAHAMREAEVEWRRALSVRTLAQISANAERNAPGLREGVQKWNARA